MTQIMKRTTVGSETPLSMLPPGTAFQGTVAGTGPVSATIVIEARNNGVDWLALGTITLTGTDRASDGFGSAYRWAQCRARLTAISGTGAVATVDIEV